MYFVEVKASWKNHIFKEKGLKSLCNRFRIPSDLKEEELIKLEGTERFQDGDCKVCFGRAGLLILEKKIDEFARRSLKNLEKNLGGKNK